MGLVEVRRLVFLNGSLLTLNPGVMDRYPAEPGFYEAVRELGSSCL